MGHIYVQGGLGSLAPGGIYNIVSNSLANPTVVTTLMPHGLTTLDEIFWLHSTTSNPLLTDTPRQVVTVISPTTFSIPVNCGTAGTAGDFDTAIISIPTTGVGVAAVVNAGRAHGLRVGDTVTITASGSTPSLDGAQVVTAVPSARSFTIGAVTHVTVAGSATTGHYVKTTYYSDVLDRGCSTSGGALVITSTIGTAVVTATCNIQGSADGTTWFNVPYALVATPRTFVVTQLGAITTAVATTYLLQELVFWRYLRLKCEAVTNVKLDLQVAYIE